MNHILRSLPFKLDEQSVPSKVQILRTGLFNYGCEDLDITTDTLLSMKRNFDLKVRGVELAIDYAHESYYEAAGWIKSLELSADNQELWAVVEWTKLGLEKVTNKEYRYLSADFMLDYTDNETEINHGCTLMGAGLTNRPFVKEMQPITQLSETGNKSKTKPKGGTKMDEKQVAEMKAALELAQSDKTKLETELSDLRKQLGELKSAKELSEKTAKFELLLSEGKACPAQKEAFIAGDFLKFAELAAPVKTTVIGHQDNEDAEQVDVNLDARKAAGELIKLADSMVAKGTAKDMRTALIKARAEKPELVKQLG